MYRYINSITVRNLWTDVEQETYKIFLLISKRRAAPFKKEPRKVKCILRISLELLLFSHLLLKRKWSSQLSGSNLTVIEIISYVIRDLKDQSRIVFSSNVPKRTNILRSIVEKKVFRINLGAISSICLIFVWRHHFCEQQVFMLSKLSVARDFSIVMEGRSPANVHHLILCWNAYSHSGENSKSVSLCPCIYSARILMHISRNYLVYVYMHINLSSFC